MTTPPKKLGSYETIREIGRGGMGIVYLARDPRLDRQVAIKVLPAEVADDPKRLSRFQREARLLASLNHPHIAAVHGFEEAEGIHFLVLEFIDGPTLEDRLAVAPLPVEEAIQTCRQIADALEAAHEAGVIHRDLKPANIKLTSDGTVKVLDFGLAKSVEGSVDSDADLSLSPTATEHITAVGVILGTAAYMSPEQARGKPVDRRTDIWAFGCLFFECLTGRKLFQGETTSDTISLILREEPDWSLLPADLPLLLRDLVRRCLEKDPRKRQRDIGDVRLRLEEVEEERTSSVRSSRDSGLYASASTSSEEIVIRPAVPQWIPWAAALAAVAVALLMWSRSPSGVGTTDGDTVKRFEIPPPAGLQLGSWSAEVVLSPDGNSVLFETVDASGVQQYWIRDLRSLEPRLLPKVTGTPFWPSWSPDSRSIVYNGGNGKLMRLDLDEDDPQPLCDANSGRGTSWGGEHVLFALEQGPIYMVAATGGEPIPVTTIDTAKGETAHRFPHFLPDGETFLYVTLPPENRRHRVMATDIHGRTPVEVLQSITCPVYAPPGYLLYQRGNHLVAQRMNPKSLELEGSPVRIDRAPPLAQAAGAPALTASRNGHLAQLPPEDTDNELFWMERDGSITEIVDIEPGPFVAPAISPDGRHIALTKILSPEESDVWILETERNVLTRLTHGPGNNARAVWSPDGRYIAFSTDRNGPWDIYRIPFPSGGDPEPVVVSESLFKNLYSWSPDGKYLLFGQIGRGTNMDLWVANADGTGEPWAYQSGSFQEENGVFSPDSRWIAYVSYETGEGAVYIDSFPEPGHKHRVSLADADDPRWLIQDELLFHGSMSSIMRTTVSTAGDRVRTGVPEVILAEPPHGGLRVLATTPKGDRFFGHRRKAEARDPRILITLNWAADLPE